jgi:Cu-Zn family superoxide dismutase
MLVADRQAKERMTFTKYEKEVSDMRYRWFGIGLVVAAVMLAAGVSAEGEERREAAAVVHDAAGAQIGVVTFIQQADRMTVHAALSGLPTGFHGFHIHSVGECVGTYTSAGSHLDPLGRHHHATHAGDLPSLLVDSDGTAELLFVSDRLTMAELFDGDGSAVIVHADPDNHGNIPARYMPEPDATTLGTGDAGARIGCGVIN